MIVLIFKSLRFQSPTFSNFNHLWRASCDFAYQAPPLFSCVRWKRLGSLGTRLSIAVFCISCGKQRIPDDIQTGWWLTSLCRAKYNVLTPSSYTNRKWTTKKTYRVAAMWLTWWQPSSIKSCLTIHHLRVFEKTLSLALFRLMDYHERRLCQFIRVYGC